MKKQFYFNHASDLKSMQTNTRFLLNKVYKRVYGIFFILFRSWVINKSVKSEYVETSSFLIFANNSISK